MNGSKDLVDQLEIVELGQIIPNFIQRKRHGPLAKGVQVDQHQRGLILIIQPNEQIARMKIIVNHLKKIKDRIRK